MYFQQPHLPGPPMNDIVQVYGDHAPDRRGDFQSQHCKLNSSKNEAQVNMAIKNTKWAIYKSAASFLNLYYEKKLIN